MKILLINYGRMGTDLHFPLSLAYIAGALKRAGCEFSVLDCYTHPFNEQHQVLFKELRTRKYQAVGFSTFLGNHSYRELKALSFDIKREFPKITIIFGGPMATCKPEMILNQMAVDVVVLGEGELSAPMLLKVMKEGGNLADVPGIMYKTPNGPLCNPPLARINDLDGLHPLPYELFKMDFYMDYLRRTDRCFGMLGSRGCYSKCTFCFLTYGKKMTFRSTDSIIDEMEYIHQQYGISKFNFLDDNFLNIPRFGMELCSKIKKMSFRPEWRYQGRVDKMEDAIIGEFAAHGLSGMTLGLESGSPTILNAIGKGITIEQSENAIALCRKYNIQFSTNFIIGFPEETDSTIEETRSFLKRNKIDSNLWINFIICYPGTPVYDNAVRTGIIKDEDAYLSGLGPLGDKPYVNVSRWSDAELAAKRDYLLEGVSMMRPAR